MKEKLLDLSTYSMCGLSIAAWVAKFGEILMILSGLISIICGLVSLLLKIRDIIKDGKITKEEKEEILKATKDVVDEINKKHQK